MMTESSCVGDECENMLEEKYSAPMPWVGLYVAAASLLCTLAMAADIFQGFRHWKLWFPCKYFTLNAASLTVIAVAMKLPVDLSTPMPGTINQLAKVSSTAFMCTMMANFMPSLGPMTSKDLLMNVTALSILVITITVNLCIQIFTEVIVYNKSYQVMFVVFMLYLLITFCSSALTIPFSKNILERKYHVLHKLASKEESEQTGNESCTVNQLVQDVTKYWIMAETSSPQFVMACSPTCSASGAICILLAIFYLVPAILEFEPRATFYNSDYKWSVILILVTQSIGVAVGTIAPIFRLFSALSFKLSLKWSNNYLRVYEVETYWTQMLVDWKSSRIPFRIGGLNCQKLGHDLRNIVLDFLIGFQILVVIICKIARLSPIFIVIMFLYCWYGCKWLKLKLAGKANSSNNHEGSKSESGLSDYVLQLQDEVELGDRTLRSIIKAVNRLIQKAEKQQPKSLIRLLEKSTGFKGVGEFDNDQVPPLYPEQPPNCWSLVVVTLTSIARALPNVKNKGVDQLLAGVSEALLYVNLVEESTDNTKGDLVTTKWAANNIWLEVELYGKWMDNDLRKMAHKGKTSAEILRLLGDKAINIITEIDKGMNGGAQDKSRYKFIVANSMYRISQTLLLDYNGGEGHTDEMLFEQLSVMIADILGACLTNLPRVISTKCQANAIEEREESVKTAARLIGQTKEFLKILQRHQLPSLDHDQLWYIDEWHAYLNLQNPPDFISSSNNETVSSSSIPLLVIDVE